MNKYQEARNTENLSGNAVLYEVTVTGNFNYPFICREPNSFKTGPCRKCLICLADNFVFQKEDMQQSAILEMILIYREDLVKGVERVGILQ